MRGGWDWEGEKSEKRLTNVVRAKFWRARKTCTLGQIHEAIDGRRRAGGGGGGVTREEWQNIHTHKTRRARQHLRRPSTPYPAADGRRPSPCRRRDAAFSAARAGDIRDGWRGERVKNARVDCAARGRCVHAAGRTRRRRHSGNKMRVRVRVDEERTIIIKRASCPRPAGRSLFITSPPCRAAGARAGHDNDETRVDRVMADTDTLLRYFIFTINKMIIRRRGRSCYLVSPHRTPVNAKKTIRRRPEEVKEKIFAGREPIRSIRCTCNMILKLSRVKIRNFVDPRYTPTRVLTRIRYAHFCS